MEVEIYWAFTRFQMNILIYTVYNYMFLIQAVRVIATAFIYMLITEQKIVFPARWLFIEWIRSGVKGRHMISYYAFTRLLLLAFVTTLISKTSQSLILRLITRYYLLVLLNNVVKILEKLYYYYFHSDKFPNMFIVQ